MKCHGEDTELLVYYSIDLLEFTLASPDYCTTTIHMIWEKEGGEYGTCSANLTLSAAGERYDDSHLTGVVGFGSCLLFGDQAGLVIRDSDTGLFTVPSLTKTDFFSGGETPKQHAIKTVVIQQSLYVLSSSFQVVQVAQDAEGTLVKMRTWNSHHSTVSTFSLTLAQWFNYGPTLSRHHLWSAGNWTRLDADTFVQVR